MQPACASRQAPGHDRGRRLQGSGFRPRVSSSRKGCARSDCSAGFLNEARPWPGWREGDAATLSSSTGRISPCSPGRSARLPPGEAGSSSAPLEGRAVLRRDAEGSPTQRHWTNAVVLGCDLPSSRSEDKCVHTQREASARCLGQDSAALASPCLKVLKVTGSGAAAARLLPREHCGRDEGLVLYPRCCQPHPGHRRKQPEREGADNSPHQRLPCSLLGE